MRTNRPSALPISMPGSISPCASVHDQWGDGLRTGLLGYVVVMITPAQRQSRFLVYWGVMASGLSPQLKLFKITGISLLQLSEQ